MRVRSLRQGLSLLFLISVMAGAVGAALAGPVNDFVGFTSPVSRESPRENFSRADKEGKIRPVSVVPLDGSTEPQRLSGSVYYMVFERDDKDPKDPWGTGKNVIDTFRPGIDLNGAPSPGIDPTAKYLYVYQVINDQKTDKPIESASVKLIVEVTELTSWGYWNGIGFAAKDKDAVRPVSATYKLNTPYQSPAPALPTIKPLFLTDVPTERGEAPRKGPKEIVQVHWDALDPATPPDLVMVLGSSDFDRYPSFRAIWSGKNAIAKNGRSTIFGFTSNLPPTIEPVRLRTTADEKDGKTPKDKGEPLTAKTGTRLVALGDEESAAGKAGVEGRVPSPFPVTPAAAFKPEVAAKAAEVVAGGAGMPFAGIPVPPADVARGGGFGGGFAQPAASSGFGQGTGQGGGIGGGTGGGSGNGNGNSNGQAAGQLAATNTIDVKVALENVNQQQQGQFQAQRQRQRQRQSQSQFNRNNNHHHHNNVVPEPASVIGLGFGLPALLFACRRRRQV
jgi:hypothetical protein